jgi:hypothetical protein
MLTPVEHPTTGSGRAAQREGDLAYVSLRMPGFGGIRLSSVFLCKAFMRLRSPAKNYAPRPQLASPTSWPRLEYRHQLVHLLRGKGDLALRAALQNTGAMLKRTETITELLCRQTQTYRKEKSRACSASC